MEGLEFVFKLNWKDGSGSHKSVVMCNTPDVTDSLELFKSNLFRIAGGVDLDEAGLRVAMEVNQANEWSIDSQMEFERALFAFRLKAIKEEIIIINVYEGSEVTVQSELANEAEPQHSESRTTLECKEPPQWFFTFMQHFKQELIEEVSSAVKSNTAVDEMHSNSSAPTLLPLHVAENKEDEDPNVGQAECGIPQKGKKPLQNILDFPSEVLLNIFQKLDHTSVAKCAEVCTKFSELSKDWELFADIRIYFYHSKEYEEWLLDRATNPKRVFFFKKCSDLFAKKIGTWHNLEHLTLYKLELGDMGEGSLKDLRSLSLISCKINCKALGKLLKHSKAICEINFSFNDCYYCGKVCKTGILSLIDLESCVGNLEELQLCGTDPIQEDLHQLRVCTSLKSLCLDGETTHLNILEATLAMEMVARSCTKLENIEFEDLDYITDNVLEILFANCTNLKNLTFDTLPNITEKSCLMGVNVLPQLQTISILYCRLITRNSESKLRDAIIRLKRTLSTKAPPELKFDL